MSKIIIDLQLAVQAENLPTHAQFQSWVECVLKSQKISGELTIRIVDAQESQILNKQYRHKNEPTNVLSFPFDNEDVKLDLPLLGDLVICASIVVQEAIEQNKSLLAHWAHMVIHGTLHLLGYDHIEEDEATEMESLEIELMQNLGFKNPYEDQ